jgi:hypothetical protein
VAYHVEFHTTTVAPYLAALALSDRARETLDNLLRSIGEHGESYRAEAGRRLFQGSEWFHVDLVFRDPESEIIHNIHLVN